MSISLSGLASNLDTAGMISKLMELERIPYTNMQAKKSNLAAEQNVFRAINTKVSTLKTAISDLRLPSTFKQMSAKSSDEATLKITAGNTIPAGNYSIEVDRLAKAHSIALELDLSGDLTGKNLSINNENVNLGALNSDPDSDPLENLRKQINSGDFGVTASIIVIKEATESQPAEKQLILTSNKTGEDGSFLVTGDQISSQTTTQQAQDAKITVNGIAVTRSTNEFKDVVEGATLNIFRQGTVTVSVSADSDKVADKVEAFVNAYNDLIGTVLENLKPPLDKSKINPLQGDSVLKSIADQAYRAVTDLVGEQINPGEEVGFVRLLSNIGLEIDKGITKASLMTGKITFDKEVFKEKLQESPNDVIDLFNRPKAYLDENDPSLGFVENDPTAGVAHRFDDLINAWSSAASGFLTSKIKGYDSEISVVDDRMERLSVRIDQKYERLKKQYTAMEVALSSLQSQQSWMASQIAMLTASAAQSKSS